jgi:hypothetical protein
MVSEILEDWARSRTVANSTGSIVVPCASITGYFTTADKIGNWYFS